MFFVTVCSFFGVAFGRITAGSTDWKEVGKANSLEPVKVMLVLRRDPAVLAKLETIFWETSDPDHEKYGQFLTQQEVTDLIAIGDDQLNTVTNYLKSAGGDVEVGAHRDLIKATLGTGPAEKMFNIGLYEYQHVRSGKKIVRAKMGSDYTMPTELDEHVDYVDNLNNFPHLTTEPTVVSLDSTSSTSSGTTEESEFPYQYSCGVTQIAVTPGVLQDRYNTDGPLAYNEAHGSMAVAEFQGQYYSQQNQLDYFNDYCKVNATIDTQVGGNDPSVCDSSEGGCTESQLDIEYIRAVGGDIHTTDVYVEDYSLLNWAMTISAMSDTDIPLVNSVSYGNDEAQNYQSYMDSCNTEFQKLAVRGISVLFASGDQGVWGREGVGSEFHPDFPAASPYVTAVGGTDFATYGVIGEEKAWNNGGGGFSDTFDIPSYQADAVAKYKSMNGLPYTGYWNNNNGRGYPDVSALAGTQNPYLVYSSSKFEGVGGTSAATPVFSAVIAQLNSIRIGQGKSALGFLNPWLYKNADCFNDVTLGNNGGAKTDSGFPATEGWDAATGLGTPDFGKLKTRI